MNNIVFISTFFLFTLHVQAFGQSYLGKDGGFEGTATIDNTAIYSAPQIGKWSKESATITLSTEIVNVRSGSNALKISMTSTTMQRVYSPQFTISSDTNKWYVQYYIKSPSNVNTQFQEYGYIRGGTEVAKTSGYDSVAIADIWEKFTYGPSTKTAATTIAGVIKTKAKGSGGDVYIDDFCIYAASTVDNTAPNPPSSPSVNQTMNSGELFVSWNAASGGVDSGGYIALRKIGTAPTGTPNANGIYAVGNTIGDGTVAYIGTATNFTDTGLLSNGTSYTYAIFTFDKAFNYSSSVTASASVPLPVELISFTATSHKNNIELLWSTATEVNNTGFEIERNATSSSAQGENNNENWMKVGFVQGSGTSNTSQNYSFTDNAKVGTYQYRLKQIDRDGKFLYTGSVEVAVVLTAEDYKLSQNYPNPFNPTTEIYFAVHTSEYTVIKVYNTIGQEVATLFNQIAEADVPYTVAFNAHNLTSGIYFYSLCTKDRYEVKKMLMTK